MSPCPVFLPLTTRVHHLPSSWTHFPKLTPVTHHTLSCSLLSRYLYSLLTHHSAWLYYMYLYMDEFGLCRVCSLGHQHCAAVCCVLFCILFCFFAKLAFLFIKIVLTCFWTQTPVFPRCPSPAQWQKSFQVSNRKFKRTAFIWNINLL